MMTGLSLNALGWCGAIGGATTNWRECVVERGQLLSVGAVFQQDILRFDRQGRETFYRHNTVQNGVVKLQSQSVSRYDAHGNVVESIAIGMRSEPELMLAHTLNRYDNRQNCLETRIGALRHGRDEVAAWYFDADGVLRDGGGKAVAADSDAYAAPHIWEQNRYDEKGNCFQRDFWHGNNHCCDTWQTGADNRVIFTRRYNGVMECREILPPAFRQPETEMLPVADGTAACADEAVCFYHVYDFHRNPVREVLFYDEYGMPIERGRCDLVGVSALVKENLFEYFDEKGFVSFQAA